MKELANQNSSSASSNPYFQLSFEEIVSFAPIFGKCKKPLRGSIRRGMTINVICLFGISTFAMAMVTLSVLLESVTALYERHFWLKVLKIVLDSESSEM